MILTGKSLLVVVVMIFGNQGVDSTVYSRQFRTEETCIAAARMLESNEEIVSKYKLTQGTVVVQADCVEP